jgi:Tfp pilus assembly protein PilF
MSQQQRGCFWHSVAFAVTLCISPYPAASAKDSGSVQDVVQTPKDDDPKAALITLKNAIRKSPQDPAIHLKIARLYFRIGDAASAEREARAARDLKGDEAE